MKSSGAERKSSGAPESPSYIEVLHTCPTGWRYPTDKMIQVSRLGVQTGWWPLFEIQDGVFKLSYKPKELKPVSDFIQSQGRFRHITDEQIDQLKLNTRHQRMDTVMISSNLPRSKVSKAAQFIPAPRPPGTSVPFTWALCAASLARWLCRPPSPIFHREAANSGQTSSRLPRLRQRR